MNFNDETVYTNDKLVGTYIAIRDTAEAMIKALEEKIKPFKDTMEVISQEMLRRSLTHGTESFKTSAGTCFRDVLDSVRVEDWETFRTWAESNQQQEMFKRDVAKDPVLSWMDSNRDERGSRPVPPGLRYSSIMKMKFHKPRKKTV